MCLWSSILRLVSSPSKRRELHPNLPFSASNLCLALLEAYLIVNALTFSWDKVRKSCVRKQPALQVTAESIGRLTGEKSLDIHSNVNSFLRMWMHLDFLSLNQTRWLNVLLFFFSSLLFLVKYIFIYIYILWVVKGLSRVHTSTLQL